MRATSPAGATANCRIAVLLAALLAPAAYGFEVRHAEVTHDEDTYRARFEVRLAAPVEAVRALSRDYDQLERFSKIIVDSERLAPDRVRVVVRACILIFCKTARRTMTIRAGAEGDMLALAEVPDNDFRHARETWQVKPEDTATRLRYDAEFVPDFFIPPIIGPWLITRLIRQELDVAAERLETLAQGR